MHIYVISKGKYTFEKDHIRRISLTPVETN